jgi:hypothetical protein
MLFGIGNHEKIPELERLSAIKIHVEALSKDA